MAHDNTLRMGLFSSLFLFIKERETLLICARGFHFLKRNSRAPPKCSVLTDFNHYTRKRKEKRKTVGAKEDSLKLKQATPT